MRYNQGMADQVEIQIPKKRVNERQAFTATAYFRTRSTKSASTPTTVEYRVDNLSTRTTAQDWTSLTPGGSVTVPIIPAHNAIQQASHTWGLGTTREERVQLVVVADRGLDTQAVGTQDWKVNNVFGV